MRKFNTIARERANFIGMIEAIKKLQVSLAKINKHITFAIGGSLAAKVWGIDIKHCHDIDIIVDKGSIDKIKDLFNNTIFGDNCTPEASSDMERNTNHVAFMFKSNYIFDFIENKLEESIITNSTYIYGIRFMYPDALYKSKEKYNRLKDLEDKAIIKNWIKENDIELYNSMFTNEVSEVTPEVTSETTKPIGDINALEELKRKLQGK